MKFLVVFCFLIIGCNLNISLDEKSLNIDFEKWKTDDRGCLGYREKVSDEIIKISDVFKGADKDSIIDMFGKPNISYTQQNAILYYITKGYHCEHPDSASDAGLLLINFNKKNKVKSIEKVVS